MYKRNRNTPAICQVKIFKTQIIMMVRSFIYGQTSWNVKSSGSYKASQWTKLVKVMETQLSYFKSWKMMLSKSCTQFSSVQLLSRVWLFVTPRIAAGLASLSIMNSRSSLRLTSTESVMPSSYLILCHPHLPLTPIPPSIRSFPMSQLFAWGGQSTGVSALASFLPKKSQGWCPSEWTGWISLQSRGLSRVFSRTTVQNHQFFGAQPKNHSLD